MVQKCAKIPEKIVTGKEVCPICKQPFKDGQVSLDGYYKATGKPFENVCEKCYLLEADGGYRAMYCMQEMMKADACGDKERMAELHDLLLWVKKVNAEQRAAYWASRGKTPPK